MAVARYSGAWYCQVTARSRTEVTTATTSVLYQLSAINLQGLQSVLNAGTSLITRKSKYNHISEDYT